MAPEPITALLVPLPEVDALVRSWREVYDPSGRVGVPAHVTVLAPFVSPETIDERVIADLREATADFAPFEVAFRRAARFFNALYLAPEPEEPFRAMTRSLVARWPECPPYGGAHPDPTPHLTLAFEQDESTFERISREAAAVLPIETRVTEIRLFIGSNDSRWEEREILPITAPGNGAPPA